MTATAKKLLSVFLAFVLVFAFTPTTALGEGEGNQQEPLEVNDLAPATLSDVQGMQGGDEPDVGTASDSPAFMTAAGTVTVSSDAASSEYETGNGYKLTYKQCTYTEGETAYNGVVITNINASGVSGHADLTIPSQIDNNNVIGFGTDDEFDAQRADNLGPITIPANVRFVGSKVKFGSGGGGINTTSGIAFASGSPVTDLPTSMFEYFNGGAVTLPAALTKVSARLFKGSNITSISLPGSVKQIDLNAFTDTTHLTSVTLNEGLETIGQEAFAPTLGNGVYGDASGEFTSITIPFTVHDIQQEAFRKVTPLKTVTFAPTSQLATIGDYAFYGTSLETVAIPDSVTTIGAGAFGGRNAANTKEGDVNPNSQGNFTLTSVQFGTSQDASNLATLGSGAFAYQPITHVTLPNKLTSLGYNTSNYSFSDKYQGKPYLVGTIGAFSKCDMLQTVTWPTSGLMTEVGGFDGCTSLNDSVVNALPSSVQTITDYAFYGCTSLSNVVIPKTVTAIKKGAFNKAAQDSFQNGAPTYTLLNKTVDIEWGDASTIATTSPFPLACGATIKFPKSAALDAGVRTFKAAVETYETAQGVSDANKTKFVETTDEFFTVTGTVPEGATVTLYAGSDVRQPTLDSTNSFSELVEGGKYVSAVVSLDGYADYRVSPDANKTSAVLSKNWTFAVTGDMMTPASQLGILQVCATGDYSEDANVAVFDHGTGKLVSQGHVMRARVYVVDDIPAGTYDVVAWQKNDYFSRVSSLGDFAAMGLSDSDYALDTEVAIAARETKGLALAVPQLDTAKISAVLATGEVVVPNLYNPPEVPFVATVCYETATGQSVDSVQVSIPAGMEPCAAATNAKEYFSVAGNVNAGSWDSATHTLTISNLDTADRQSGTIALSLKATQPGSYAISAALKSGSATAPIGSAPVEVPAVRLVAPQGTLQSREFTVHVYAAPNSTIELKIGDTVLSVDKKTLDAACTTNFVGHAKVNVKIPDEEISVSPYYQVTATLKSDPSSTDDPSDTAIVQYNAALSDVPFEPSIHDFSFESAGDQVWLAKGGQDLSGGYYIVGVHQDNFTRQMPFTVAIDSLQPLEDTTTLYLGMLDNSVTTHTMYLSETTELKSGAKRYTFKTIVPITENDEFLSRNIPCRFDVIPGFKQNASTVRPELSTSEMGTLKLAVGNETDRLSKLGAAGFNKWYSSLDDTGRQCVSGEYYYTSKLGTQYGYKYYNEVLVNAGYDYVFGVFNESFRHEKWDPTGAVWNRLSSDEKAEFEQAEAHVAAAYDALALLLGDSKPMYAYPSYEAYLAAELGYTTGGSYDKGALADDGYLVIDDLYDSTWGAANVTVPDDGRVLPTQEDIMMTTASTTAEDGRIGSFKTKNGKGEAANKRVNGKTDVDVAIETIEDSTEFVMNIVRSASPETGQLIDGFAVKATGLARSVYEPIDDEIKSRSDYTGIDSELTNRKAELERMESMNKYYDTYNPGSICQRALQAEIDYMKQYIADLEWAKRFAWYGEIGTVAGGASIEFSEKVGEYAKGVKDKISDEKGKKLVDIVADFFDKGKTLGLAARQAWGSQAALPSVLLAPDLAKHRAQVQQWRFYRERECKKDDFGKLHYNKKPILDPSGFTYEGVESARVEGVTATIYQKIADTGADGDWAIWDAASYDQANPQTTTSTGLYAWDVPEGDWKVLFQKEGYDDVWSQVMHVLPQWTDVAINMLRSAAPAGTSAAVNADDEDAPYVDITFDQFMQAAASPAPTVTVGGAAVAGVTWVDATTGRDASGQEVQLSRVLRVPLAGLATPGEPVEVAVSGAVSYTGKAMAAPYTAAITVPAPEYYYVAPSEAAAFTKGSGADVAFTFKRSFNDDRTFGKFTGILVDGKAVDAANYTAVAGSVVVTLKAAYLETLSEGAHVLTAQFADGSATADFAVTAPAATKASKTRAATPATGDHLAPMGMLLLVAGLACCAMIFARTRMAPRRPIGKHARR